MDSTTLFAPGTKPELISSQFSFTEGPAADSEGNIYFTDQPNNSIWKYSINKDLTLFTDNAARANGMYIDKSGNVVACADELGEIVSFAMDGSKKVLTQLGNDKRYNGPNDLWITPDQGIYFTDPYYERNYWPDPKPIKHKENTYYLPPGKTKAIPVETEIEKPNGIIGTPDGKTLFIADIGAGKIYQYSINTDGTLSNKKLFTDMGSDGVTLDEHGNFYIVGKGVTIFNTSGKQIGHIPIDEGWTANLCFGGRDNNTLFITASKSFYKMPMLVHGLR